MSRLCRIPICRMHYPRSTSLPGPFVSLGLVPFFFLTFLFRLAYISKTLYTEPTRKQLQD